jgi:hypothetical protein
MGYTTPSTAVSFGTLTTNMWNLQVRDNLNYLNAWGTTLAGTAGTAWNLTSVAGTLGASVNLTNTQGSVVATQGSVVSTQNSILSKFGNLSSSYLRVPVLNNMATKMYGVSNTSNDDSYYLLLSNASGGGTPYVYYLAYTNNAGTSYTFPTTNIPQSATQGGRFACSSNGSVIYFAPYGGTTSGNLNIYVSTNSGTSFTATTSGTTTWSNYQPVCSSSGSTVYAIKSGTAVIYSNNTGSTWSTATISPLNANTVVCSSNGAIAYAITNGTSTYSGGTVYKTSDYGATWGTVTSVGYRSWTDISCSSNGSVVALAATYGTSEFNSYLYLSTDAGITWNTLNNAGLDDWYAVAVSSNGNFIVAYNGYDKVVTSKDGGNTFTNKEFNVPAAISSSNKIKFTPSGSAVIGYNSSYTLLFKCSF